MDDATFVNMYLEKILNEVGELTKARLLNETRILFLEKANADLLERLKFQEEETEKAKARNNKKKSESNDF